MRTKALISIASVLFVSVACIHRQPSGSTQATSAQSPSVTTPANRSIRASIGFASQQKLREHFDKHGAEFGSITIEQYLLQAQTLRDREVGGDILEHMRGDGVTNRFDRKNGAFIAFNHDGTIRTYFRPNAGERYFQRQLDQD